MFSGENNEQSDGARASLPRVSSGAIRSLKDTFTDVEKEYAALRAKLAEGQIAIEIDPNLIDPSPMADRFVEQDEASFEALKTSIRERGQEIPVLVREHPTAPNRYQSAYGHRRVRAARDLGMQVRAYVRPLTDHDLVVAQGLENSAREDLTFIERAMFAFRLESKGFDRATIQTALSVDRAEVSKLIAVVRELPEKLVLAIGRAPKIGRGRWQQLQEALQSEEVKHRVLNRIEQQDFNGRPTDERFTEALGVAIRAPEARPSSPAHDRIRASDGADIGQVKVNEKQWRLTISREANDGFARYLTEKLPALYAAYHSRSTETSGEG
jgi:ParB family chromosome partitioning protein